MKLTRAAAPAFAQTYPFAQIHQLDRRHQRPASSVLSCMSGRGPSRHGEGSNAGFVRPLPAPQQPQQSSDDRYGQHSGSSSSSQFNLSSSYHQQSLRSPHAGFAADEQGRGSNGASNRDQYRENNQGMYRREPSPGQNVSVAKGFRIRSS